MSRVNAGIQRLPPNLRGAGWAREYFTDGGKAILRSIHIDGASRLPSEDLPAPDITHNTMRCFDSEGIDESINEVPDLLPSTAYKCIGFRDLMSQPFSDTFILTHAMPGVSPSCCAIDQAFFPAGENAEII